MKRFCLLLIGLMTLWSCQPDEPVILIPDDSDVENVEKPDNGETPENPDNSDDSDEAAEAAEFESREVPPVKPHTGGKIIVGYITYWEEIMPDPTLLTHINYAFGHIRSDFENFDIKTPSRLKKVVELKKENPNLKVLLSIGGWEAGNFSEMAADPVHRVNFAKNCLAAVEKYDLDGIDIDWEYPSSSSAGISSSPYDIKNFNLVIRDLRIALGSDKLVTIATYAKVKYFDLHTLNQYLDFVNIMTYDMGKPPYHNAALYPSSASKFSCDEAVEKHHTSGMPYEKLVLGVPFYGKEVSGSVNYVDLITSKYSKYNKCWDDEAMVPYLADDSGTMIMTYDDEQSVGLKAEYIKSKGLLGAMYWSIEGDDASWTLSKALASRLLPLNDDSADEELPEYLVTNTYMQDFMEKVTYPDGDNSYTLIHEFLGGGPGEADLPAAVTLEWDLNGYDQNLSLSVWDKEWSRKYSLAARTTKQELINLVPGLKYNYELVGKSGDLIAKGAFRTLGSVHQMYFPASVRNSRDLGGWKTVDGKTVAYRKLYRGGAVENMISNTGIAEWRAAGIKAELDLAAAESVPSKSPVGVDIAFCAPGFPDGYETMLKDYADGVKEAMTFVAECLRNDKPVFIHCPEGRDQTGTVAILTLGLLGVSEGDISKDYELTYFAPKEWSLYQGAFEHDRTSRSFTGTCEYIKSFGGATFAESVENYLLSIGVTQQNINDIRSKMLK